MLTKGEESTLSVEFKKLITMKLPFEAWTWFVCLALVFDLDFDFEIDLYELLPKLLNSLAFPRLLDIERLFDTVLSVYSESFNPDLFRHIKFTEPL